MQESAAELLVERLVDWGVDTVFGRPGEDGDAVLASLRRRAGRIRFVLVHHEEAAAFMACGYAKATGRLGVALATSGPGAIHLLNGLYDAKLDHQPVLAVTELLPTRLLGTRFQQEVSLDRLFADVADYNAKVHVPVQIPAMVDIAAGHALTRGTVAHITFPPELEDEGRPPSWAATTPSAAPATAPLFVPAPGVPEERELARAAAVLNRGRRVAMLVGVGALDARAELLAVAERLASPIVKSLPGKAAVPDDHPLTTGCVGALGTRPSERALTRADALLVVGTNFPYARHLPEPEQVHTVQIETDLSRVGRSGPSEVPLVGDAAETLAALLPLLEPAADRSFLAEAQAGMAAWRRYLAGLESLHADTIRAPALLRAIDRLAADDAILASDSGPVATWSARHFDVRGGRSYLLSANLATMAAALPYAIAAQWAHPTRQAIAVLGAQGFAKLMAEFLTAVEHDLPVKVVVLNDSASGRAGQAARFAPWAQACGGTGLRAEQPAEMEAALKAALSAPGPALVDVRVPAIAEAPGQPGRVGSG